MKNLENDMIVVLSIRNFYSSKSLANEFVIYDEGILKLYVFTYSTHLWNSKTKPSSQTLFVN